MAPKYKATLSPPVGQTDDPKFNPALVTDQLRYSPLQSPPESPILLPGKAEREGYYFGLASQPLLLARTSRTSTRVCPPLGPDICLQPKQLRNVGKHQVVDKWDDAMAAEVFKILEAYSVQWTSVELFRIGHGGQDMPVILWIGVRPGTLTDKYGASLPAAGKVAVACRGVFRKHGILDVECEIKESEVYRGGAGPALVKPSTHSSPIVDIAVFFAPTIGTCIAPAVKGRTPEGTLGFYVTFPNHPGKVYGVTCRHVLFPSRGGSGEPNKLYSHKNRSEPRRQVILPGDRFLGILKERAKEGREVQQNIVDAQRKKLAALVEREGQDPDRGQAIQDIIKGAQKTIGDFDQWIRDLDNKWKDQKNRVVGHVVYAPPISTEDPPHNYTLDWCLYEVDLEKIKDFSGNVIDLGHEGMGGKIGSAMNPNIRNPYKFAPLSDRQWPIQNTCIPLDEMKHPKTFDENNSPALSVLKRGRATGVTCGVANEIESYIRTYAEVGSFKSKEWAIVGFDEPFNPFSKNGDSGALVVDAQGRMGGMLTGGSGKSVVIDVSYATPMVVLLKDMEKHGWPNANTNVAPQAVEIDSRRYRSEGEARRK